MLGFQKSTVRRSRIRATLKKLFHRGLKKSFSHSNGDDVVWLNADSTEASLKSTKNQAKQRLQVLLVYDQIGLSGTQMEAMKSDIFDVIRNYLVVHEDESSFVLSGEKNNVTFSAAVPIQRAVRQ